MFSITLHGPLAADGIHACSYSWTKSSDECITELKWPSIHQHHACLFLKFMILITSSQHCKPLTVIH